MISPKFLHKTGPPLLQICENAKFFTSKIRSHKSAPLKNGHFSTSIQMLLFSSLVAKQNFFALSSFSSKMGQILAGSVSEAYRKRIEAYQCAESLLFSIVFCRFPRIIILQEEFVMAKRVVVLLMVCFLGVALLPAGALAGEGKPAPALVGVLAGEGAPASAMGDVAFAGGKAPEPSISDGAFAGGDAPEPSISDGSIAGDEAPEPTIAVLEAPSNEQAQEEPEPSIAENIAPGPIVAGDEGFGISEGETDSENSPGEEGLEAPSGGQAPEESVFDEHGEPAETGIGGQAPDEPEGTCIGDPAYIEIPGWRGTGDNGDPAYNEAPGGPEQAGDNADAIETFGGNPIIHITETGLWSTQEWSVLKLTNAQRLKKGLRPLSTFKSLQQATRKRANEIVSKFDHYRPNGSICFTVLDDYGISYYSAGENIAAGYPTPAAVLDGWMNSPGHKANILTSGFVHMGAGYANSGSGYVHHWVQLFTGGCSVTGIEVGSLSANPVFRPGSSIDNLNLIVVLTCPHGKSYLPLVSAMCTGYNKNSLAEQTVTVKYGALSTDIAIQLTPRVAYDGNGADSGSPPTDLTNYKSGDSVTVKGSGTLAKAGFAFEGWTQSPDGTGKLYKKGSKFKIGSANVTFYAKWERIIVIVTQPTASTTVAEGEIPAGLRLAVEAELDGSSAGLGYQWYSSLKPSNATGAEIEGETGADFDIPADLGEGAYYYFCEVSAPGVRAVRTKVATVIVTPPSGPVISISSQPADLTVTEGDVGGSLSVTAYVTQGAGLYYEWYGSDHDGVLLTGVPLGDGPVFAIPADLTEGIYYYFCEVSDPGNPGDPAAPTAKPLSSNVAAVTVLPPAAADGLVVSPTHAVLASAGDMAVFSAEFKGGAAVLSELDWSISPEAAPGSGIAFVNNGDGTATVELTSPDVAEAILVVTAKYQENYSSAATVEIVPGGVAAGITEVRLLATKATINVAKENPSARVPVLVSNREEVKPTLMSASAKISPLADPPPLNFTPAVELEVNKAKAGKPEDWQELKGFSATMSDFDSRYIEIEALPDPATGKYPGTTRNVRVVVDGAVAGSLNLMIVESYPKITVKAGQLNLFYPNESTGFSATANDGSKVTVLAIDHFADKDKTIAAKQTSDPLKLVPLKAGTANFKVSLKLDGYARATKSGDTVKASVKVVNAVPKLKLSPAALTMAGNQPAPLALLPSQKNVALAGLGTIRSVKLDDVDVNRYQGGGVIKLPGNLAAGAHVLKVDFVGGAKTVDLKLTVKRVDPSKTTVSSATKAIAVNTNHSNGDIITVGITPSAKNLVISDWVQTNTKVAMPAGIGFAPGANSITFSVTDKAQLSPTAKAVSLEFNSSSSPLAKPFKISLSVTGKTASFSLSQKGKIDIANPASEITATVKLANTTSAIAGVKLYDQAFDAGKRFIDPVAAGVSESSCFEVGGINGNAFTIKAKAGKLVPGAAKKLSVYIVLANGDTLTSWGADSKGIIKDAKAITIKPKQTIFKATQGKRAVTLYKQAPQVGEQIELGFAVSGSASGAPGATLADVEINKASVGKNDYFELVRGGRDTWELKLKDGFDPYLKNDKGKSAYKSTYVVKLELWAEDTYGLDGAGKPVALTEGKYRSKPTIVTVKVSLK